MTAAIASGMSLLPRVPDTDATHRLDFFNAAVYACYARQKWGMGCRPQDGRYAGMPTWLSHTLGELHAAGAVYPLCPGHGGFYQSTWDNGATCLATLRHIVEHRMRLPTDL
jgi:hypothetical protein